MKYSNIKEAEFLGRPNRFIAICNVDGVEEICHVKNTGRCRELLTQGVKVYLEKSNNPNRKTKYDLVAVKKGNEIFNIDSQAPNYVVQEWIEKGGLFCDVTMVKPEAVYGGSRFDFYVEHGGISAFVEVKGVTLEEDGVLLFPDAPTVRGVKHINELINARKNGYEAYIIFVVQTEKAKYFTPNMKTHKEFGEALELAYKNGVKILCYSCRTGTGYLEIGRPVPVKLSI